ncbi:MAG TPA: hypothetical protein VNM92_07145 [Thermoanaerobaculia bacterium]|nr:hypothetical protein [Thermoanaerobaculia bacterium]
MRAKAHRCGEKRLRCNHRGIPFQNPGAIRLAVANSELFPVVLWRKPCVAFFSMTTVTF